MYFFLTVVGMIFIVEGVPYLASPRAMKAWGEQLTAMRASMLRLLGAVSLGCGLLILYVTRRFLG